MTNKKQIRRDSRQMFHLCLTGDKLDENRVRLVVKSVLRSTSRDQLLLLKQFQRLVDRFLRNHLALVESAGSLAPEAVKSVQGSLARVYGRELNVSFALRPALIGGIRIRVGTDVYDNSIRARLDALESRL